MQFSESTAKAWLTSNIGSLVPPNTRRYTHGVVTQSLGTNLLGMKTDLCPFEGVVVHCGDGFYVVKTGRNAFNLVDPSILRETLIEGSKVRITPYQRRRFNGTLLSDPDSIEDNGTYLTKTYVLGVNHSEIPLATPQTQYLLDALDLLHRGKCPDGVRLISNMLVDINATNFSMQEPIVATHDDDGNEVTAEQWHEPQISFDCKSNTFAGRVTVGVDVASDTYFVDLQKPDETGALQPHALQQRLLRRPGDGLDRPPLRWGMAVCEDRRAQSGAESQAVQGERGGSMLTFTTFPAHVRYLLPNMAVDVAVSDAVQAQAVEAFALENGFEVPAPSEARPVYHCIARTHENGEVLWG